MKDQNDEDERNWLWLAADSKGELAIFETMRIGACPKLLRESVRDAELLDEFVDDLVITGKPNCIGHFNRADDAKASRSTLGASERRYLDAHIEGVKRTASLGFYLYVPYSTSPRPGGYAQAGYPSVPRLLTSLPREIQRIVESYRLMNVRFDQSYCLETEIWEQH